MRKTMKLEMRMGNEERNGRGEERETKNTPREFSGSIASHKSCLTTAIRQKQNAIFLKFMLIKEKYLINPSPLHWHRVPQQSCHRV